MFCFWVPLKVTDQAPFELADRSRANPPSLANTLKSGPMWQPRPQSATVDPLVVQRLRLVKELTPADKRCSGHPRPQSVRPNVRDEPRRARHSSGAVGSIAMLAGPAPAKLRAFDGFLPRCFPCGPVIRDDFVPRLPGQASCLTVTNLPDHLDGANPSSIHSSRPPVVRGWSMVDTLILR